MKNIKNFKVLYSAVVLDEKSKSKLLSKISVPDGWETIAHHMTIVFGKGLESVNMEDLKGENLTLTVTHLGVSDKAIAVKVSGCYSTNKISHITVAVDSKNGGKPVMSNDITNWSEIQSFTLNGIVTEITK